MLATVPYGSSLILSYPRLSLGLCQAGGWGLMNPIKMKWILCLSSLVFHRVKSGPCCLGAQGLLCPPVPLPRPLQECHRNNMAGGRKVSNTSWCRIENPRKSQMIPVRRTRHPCRDAAFIPVPWQKVQSGTTASSFFLDLLSLLCE